MLSFRGVTSLFLTSALFFSSAYSDPSKGRTSADDLENFKPGHHKSSFAAKNSDELLQMSYLEMPTGSALIGTAPNGNQVEIRSLGGGKLSVIEKDQVSDQIVQTASIRYDSASDTTTITNPKTGEPVQIPGTAIKLVVGALAVVGILIGAFVLKLDQSTK